MRAMPCNVKIIVKCVIKVVVNYTDLTLKCEIGMKCMLKIDISHARKALACENRY